MTTVAVCGGVNWDEIWLLADDPLQHGKVEALAVHRALGGSAANTASWLAVLVERVELIGAVGEDPEGRACLDWLDLAGVGCGSVEVIAGAGTSRACCWSAAASKRIVTRREPALRRDHASALALAALASAEHLHLASTTDAAALQCLRVAVGGGLSVSVELSGRRLDEARRHADVVFLNAAELLTVFGVGLGRLDADAVASVAPKRGATLVITNGAESVVCATAAGTQAFPVEVAAEVLDRTGGGDAFDAGFIAGWLRCAGDLHGAVASGLACARRHSPRSVALAGSGRAGPCSFGHPKPAARRLQCHGLMCATRACAFAPLGRRVGNASRGALIHSRCSIESMSHRSQTSEIGGKRWPHRQVPTRRAPRFCTSRATATSPPVAAS